jgi:hypothetical protein
VETPLFYFLPAARTANTLPVSRHPIAVENNNSFILEVRNTHVKRARQYKQYAKQRKSLRCKRS